MALRFLEGFESRNADTYFQRQYGTVTNLGGFASFPVGRKIGLGLQSNITILVSKALVTAVENTWVLGFAFRKADLTQVTGTAYVGLRNSAGDQVRLHLIDGTQSGVGFRWELRRGATVLATSASQQAGGIRAWHYFQLKVTVRTGTNGAYELRRYDEFGAMTVLFSGTLANTANQGSDGADRFEVSWNTGNSNLIFDDIFALDSTGSLNNDFVSKPVVILGLLPDADGNRVQWTPSTAGTHFNLVDDAATSPNDADKITSPTVGNVDLFTMTNPNTPSGTTVIGVQINITAALENSGTRTLKLLVRSAGSEAQAGSNIVVNTTTLQTFWAATDQNPVGPAAWTVSSLAAAEMGVELFA